MTQCEIEHEICNLPPFEFEQLRSILSVVFGHSRRDVNSDSVKEAIKQALADWE
jgi:hypothetical protein